MIYNLKFCILWKKYGLSSSPCPYFTNALIYLPRILLIRLIVLCGMTEKSPLPQPTFGQQKTLWQRMGDKASSATFPLRVANLWEGTKKKSDKSSAFRSSRSGD
jgi:hypothetical protein